MQLAIALASLSGPRLGQIEAWPPNGFFDHLANANGGRASAIDCEFLLARCALQASTLRPS
jgi:hypothetical protein